MLVGVLAACQGAPAAPSGYAAEAPAASSRYATEAPAAAESNAAAGEAAMTPMVEVSDQPVVNGTVTVAKAVSAGPGWIVIHAQADGKPGPVVGHAALADGVNENVTVEIDESAATDVLYAMLHTDAGEVGTYEFPGADGPVKDAEGKVITPPFNVTMEKAAGGEAMGEPVVLLGGNDALGEFLTGDNGMTLYVFAKDGPGESYCYDQCAQNWPPLLVEEGQDPTAGEGVGGELSVIKRDDGGLQVAHNGMPLYFWAGDANPGDATGDGVGGVWSVARPGDMGEAAGGEAMGEPVVLLGGNDALGKFLTGANGMTLYVFAKDGPGESYCYDQCAQNWPPLLVEEGQEPTAGEGVDGELSVIKRDDGGLQVAHNGMPLYFWAGDANPGDATGDGVGGVWSVAR